MQLGSFDELVTSTVGRHQRLRVSFRTPAAEVAAPLALDGSGKMGSCLMSDTAAELPGLMQALQAGDTPIDNVVLQGPTLQDVFLHLTGKELRE